MKQSLGLLEVCGLALAISCADIMAKSASITLVALEKTNGSGWTVIKITGDVASVQAAITTGAQFAEQRNGLVAHKVIARPGEGILRAEAPRPPSCNLSLKRQGRQISFRQRQQKSFPSNTAWSAATCASIQNVHARRVSRARFAFIPASEVKRNG